MNDPEIFLVENLHKNQQQRAGGWRKSGYFKEGNQHLKMFFMFILFYYLLLFSLFHLIFIVNAYT